MKIYDKEIYNRQKSINTTATIIIAFVIGFAVGYFANAATLKYNKAVNNTTNNNITSNEVTKTDTI